MRRHTGGSDHAVRLWEVATGKVTGLCLSRHRHKEFLVFLKVIDGQVPKGLDVHLVLDNYGTHNHPNVKAWLAKQRMVG